MEALCGIQRNIASLTMSLVAPGAQYLLYQTPYGPKVLKLGSRLDATLPDIFNNLSVRLGCTRVRRKPRLCVFPYDALDVLTLCKTFFFNFHKSSQRFDRGLVFMYPWDGVCASER